MIVYTRTKILCVAVFVHKLIAIVWSINSEKHYQISADIHPVHCSDLLVRPTTPIMYSEKSRGVVNSSR